MDWKTAALAVTREIEYFHYKGRIFLNPECTGCVLDLGVFGISLDDFCSGLNHLGITRVITEVNCLNGNGCKE